MLTYMPKLGGRYIQKTLGVPDNQWDDLDELRRHDDEGNPEPWREFFSRAIPILKKNKEKLK